MLKICLNCNKEFDAPDKEVKRGRAKYCSRSCSGYAIARNKAPLVPNVECAYCTNAIYRPPSKMRQSRSGLFFCDRQCKELAQAAIDNPDFDCIRPDHYNRLGIGSYRRRALKEYGEKCDNPDCPFTGQSVPVKMLDVHHIDSNRSNNTLENLQVLCVWCHALETRAKWP